MVKNGYNKKNNIPKTVEMKIESGQRFRHTVHGCLLMFSGVYMKVEVALWWWKIVTVIFCRITMNAPLHQGQLRSMVGFPSTWLEINPSRLDFQPLVRNPTAGWYSTHWMVRIPTILPLCIKSLTSPPNSRKCE